jgi:hypothetical protein
MERADGFYLQQKGSWMPAHTYSIVRTVIRRRCILSIGVQSFSNNRTGRAIQTMICQL